MPGFTKDFNAFFRELAANNHKEWFDENRGRYEKNVKAPFETFVGELIQALTENFPKLEPDPKKAIFRINRDIRFSKDKIPYKLNRAAFISPNGRKAEATPGFYIQLGPEAMYLGGGIYRPDKTGLMRIRRYMAAHDAELRDAVGDSKFQKAFGTVKGNANKRLPNAELKTAAAKQPLIFNKQFYYMNDFPANRIEKPGLLDFVIRKLLSAERLHEYLARAAAE